MFREGDAFSVWAYEIESPDERTIRMKTHLNLIRILSKTEIESKSLQPIMTNGLSIPLGVFIFQYALVATDYLQYCEPEKWILTYIFEMCHSRDQASQSEAHRANIIIHFTSNENHVFFLMEYKPSSTRWRHLLANV